MVDDNRAEVEERERLRYVRKRIEEMLMHLGAIPRYFSEDTTEPQTADEVAQKIVEDLRDEQVDGLMRSNAEPYFGRLDLRELGQKELAPIRLYIGKRGIEDLDTSDRLVVDWRAPISSIFYSFSGEGTAIYEAPDGEIEADVHLKRNIAVRNGEFQRVVDSYVKGQENLNVTDEFLLYRLTENKDNRLRDIVSTIQAEQDRIIRADRNRSIVIQGVAGSGKTTVALHRLAYLLYQHADRMRTDRMVIFAPNAMFVDYISEVLPELGVGGIRQTTFAKWALQMLDQQVSLRDPAEHLEDWFTLRPTAAIEAKFERARCKGSLAFQREIDDHIQHLEDTMIPEGDFEPWEGRKLEEATIREWFYTEYQHYPIAKRRDRVVARVKRWMDTAYRDIKEDDKTGSKKKTAAQRYRAYSKKWPELTPFGIYEQMPSSELPKKLQKRAGRPVVDAEDMAPLLYIHQRINGVDGTETFHHVVIDEAQDFSALQMAVLRGYCPSQSFTILGDLSQSIHGYQGISDWDDFLHQFPEDIRSFFKLDVSYRSTVEIIEFANRIIRNFDQFTEAKPVFRSGDEVTVTTIAPDERIAKAVAAVRELAEHSNTVAVVGRTEAECQPVYDALAAEGIEANLITSSQQSYRGGISVLPVYLTKGLEFDAVLLLDVDAEHYDLSPLSAKLLYVGCTRALHKLSVHTTDHRSPLLAESDDDRGADGGRAEQAS